MLSDTNESTNVPQYLHDVNNDCIELSLSSGYSSGYDPTRISSSDQVEFGETLFNAIPASAGTHFICPITGYITASANRGLQQQVFRTRKAKIDRGYFDTDIKFKEMERKSRLFETRSFSDIRNIKQDEYDRPTINKDVGGGSRSKGIGISGSDYRNESGNSRNEQGLRGSSITTNDYKNLNKTNSNETVTNTISNSGKKQEIATAHVFSEDMRISKMLRRLCSETNPTVAIELCEKLKIVIMDSSNAAYIHRAFDFLAESIISILHQGPIECLDEVAKVFGMLGYVIRNEFPIYKCWISRNYESSKSIRVYLMKALKTTIKYDAKTLDLINYSDRFLNLLKDWLETADIVEHFIAVSDVVAEFANNYKKSFEKHFTDIVDIVVGWHLETEQSSKLKQHCSYVLQQFSEFFIKKFDFTISLLGQFLEDITAFGEDIQSTNSSTAKGIGGGASAAMKPLTGADNKTSTPEISVGSFIGAFVSVMKCLSTDREIIAFKLGRELFNDAIKIITNVSLQSLRITTSQETVQSINEFFVIILTQQQQYEKENKFDDKKLIQYDSLKIFEIIKIELEIMQNFDNTRIDSLLFLMVTYVNTLKSKTPIDMITFCLDTRKCKELSQIKFTSNHSRYKLLMKFYHKVLTIKNVPLLQEAYKFILIDMKFAMKCLKVAALSTTTTTTKDTDNLSFFNKEKYSIKQAECIITFYFTALAILASQTSSIIGMYALQPSILELLINELDASKVELWSKYPILYDTLITILSEHCIKNHNYISSSNILMKNIFNKLSDTTSPSSENFSLILKFFAEILSSLNNTSTVGAGTTITTRYPILAEKTLLQLLNWISILYEGCIEYSNFLKNNSSFISIGKNICILSIQTISKIITKKCSQCIEILLKYPEINQQILMSIAEICCIHIFSTDIELKTLYSKLFAKLPLGISLRQSYNATGLYKTRELQINDLQHWYVASQTSGTLREKYFKHFIEKISPITTANAEEESTKTKSILPELELKCEEQHKDQTNEIDNEESPIEKYVKDIFPKCWIFQSGRIEEYCNVAQSDWNCLIPWLQWESSQYCVNNKLRTSLGKPQETFLKIEAILKDYARILALKGDSNVKCIQPLIANQKNARILLGFIECLEKSIYNAAEGTAFSIPAPEKSATRTFFRVNTSTCNEWFSRIRTAINLIALHTMESEMVIRNSEVMLQILVTANRTSESLFEHILMSMVWALLKIGESETLHGLYIWVKKVSGKRITWIKHAAEHAAGHREKAVEGYMSVISSVDDKLEGSIREFLFEQIVDCLYFTSQWIELKEFIANECTMSNEQRSTSPLMSLTTSQIESIINLEGGNNHRTLLELSDWEIFEQDKDEFCNNFSCHKLLSLTENTLVNIALNKKDDTSALKQLKICTSVIHSGLQQCLRTKSKEYLNNFIILNNIMNQITINNNNNRSNNDENVNSVPLIVNHKVCGSVTLIRIMRWLNLLQPTKCLDNLNLQVIALARKEGNLKFCQQELEKFFKRKKILMALGDLSALSSTEDNFDQICTSLMDLNANIWTSDVLHGISEIGKCWFSTGNVEKQENAIQLISSCCISAMQKTQNHPDNSERLSRMMLTLSDWLSQRSNNGDIIQNQSSSGNKPIQKLLMKIPNIETYADEKANSVVSPVDAAVGQLIKASTRQYTNLAKSWGALGNWFYRWGRKIVELRADAHADKAGLRTDDIEAIKKLLPNAVEYDIEKIVKILNRHQVTADDEEIGANDISSTELIENQLREIDLLKNVDSTIILSIIQIWKQAHKSVYRYYEMAADSYFKYLNLATSSSSSVAAIKRETSCDEDEDEGDCSMVTATLRLLRLVVKHAIGLQEVLEEGLATTPTKPWKVIIPQLFSRLNHHESYVRKRVSELLCRVAEDSPHLIIFPAVVGSIQEEKTDSNDDDSTETTSKLDEITEISNPLIFCFSSLLDTLSKQAPETVEQVQMLVRELKRVTLLWDEFWLHSLAQLYSEYLALFNALESEVREASENKLELLNEKHRILMSYVAEDMQKLYKVTSRHPETNYERNFQEKYSKVIESTIESIKRPLNYEKPNESWQKIKQLYGIFQQKLQKSSQLSLKMADISPILANMKNTAISMPGVETGEHNPIYIKSVDNIVHVLPTKTKPKKLAFFGSDGKRYTYLFKGLEDLHLDERIMQFLSISNSMMSKSNNCIGNAKAYRAHHYSVIPLGSRSGLISWVDGVTPIFALYKKWQQREAANPKKDKQYTAMRPSELFFNKLTPLLAEHNIKTTDNRKTWPISVLRKVLEELSNETPRDLLAKELWCRSNNAAAWRKAIQTYSLSVAVMSVIGYVIGLGDRHLDNVLVKLSTGDIVHIDYNVCFEKGKTLRVPEKVPFRMTPNLEEALGITGIEGTFRLACEHVLKTLRKERETLLTLLEAFVYDPLVDWTVSDDGATTTTTNVRTTKAYYAAADISALGGVSGGGGGTSTSTPSSTSFAAVCAEGITAVAAATTIGHNNPTIGATNPGGDSVGGGGGDLNNDNTTKATTSTTSSTVTTATAVQQASSSNQSSPDHRKHASKKKYENEVMRNTLTSRFSEIQPEWTQYRNEINEQLIQLSEQFKNYEKHCNEIRNDEQQRDMLTRQLAMVREVETLGTAMSSHPLNTLSQRYSAYKLTLDEFKNIKGILYERQKSYEIKYQSYYQILTKLNNQNNIETMIRESQCELDELVQIQQIDNEFDLIKEFLDNNTQCGGLDLYTQADQSRKELNVSYLQQSFIIKIALETLCQYLNIAKFCPRSYLKKHRLVRYVEWCKQLLSNPDSYHDIVKEFKTMLASDKTSPIVDASSEHALPYAFELNKLWIEMDFNLRKNYDALNNESPEYNEQFLKDSQEAITIFHHVKPDGSQNALQNEYLSNVCDLIENYISFEESFTKSVKETFLSNLSNILDENYNFTMQLLDITKIIFSNNSEFLSQLTIYLDTLNLYCNVIQSFRDIENYFQIQIIPKIIHLFMLDDDHDIMKTLDEFINFFNIIDFNLTMNKLNNNLNCREDCEILKLAYERITKKENSSENNSELINFITLIDQVFSSAYNNLSKYFNTILNLQQNDKFENLDHMIRSKSIVIPIADNYSISLLLQRFEIKKFQTISNFISIAKQLSKSLKENNLQMIYDHRILLQPITKFIGDCILELIIGQGSYLSTLFEIQLINSMSPQNPIVDHSNLMKSKTIVLSLIEKNLSSNQYTLDTYNCAKAVYLNLNIAIKKRHFIETLKRLVFIQTETLHHFGYICNAHSWMNEKFIGGGGGDKSSQITFAANIIPKNVIYQNFQTAIQNLNAWHISINKIKEEFNSYVTIILQHLKWSTNANANSNNAQELQNSFEEIITRQNHKYHENMKISSKILNYCTTIVNFEALLINSHEIKENDEQFSYCLTQFDKSYVAHKTATNHITPIEEAIVQLLDPEGVIDHFWINNISDLLDEMTDNIQQKIANLEKDLTEIQDNLQIQIQKLKSIIDNEIRMDVRYLIKMISKIDSGSGGGSGSGSNQLSRYKQFQNDYKQFFIRMNDFYMKISNKEFNEDGSFDEIQELIKKLQNEFDDLYREFLSIITEKSNSLEGREKRDGSEGRSMGHGVKDGRKGNQSEQKRNAYAVSVWRRIRMKLEGRDPDPNRRLTIQEQVDWMIREAMNPDNLAVLYEGWTPWV